MLLTECVRYGIGKQRLKRITNGRGEKELTAISGTNSMILCVLHCIDVVMQ